MRTTKCYSFSQRAIRHLKRISPLIMADIIILVLAYALVYPIRMESFPTSIDANTRLFLLYAIIITLAALYSFGGYQRIWARTSGHDVQVVVSAAVTATLVLVALDLIVEPRPIPVSVVLVAQLVAQVGFVAVRYRTRVISGFSWRWNAIWHQRFPEQATRVLVIGAGDAGQTTAWRLKHRAPKNQRYQLVGFIDDDLDKQHLYVEGCQVLGTRSDIPEIVKKHDVELIVVAIHNIDGPGFREVLEYCEKTTARIKTLPDIFALFDNQGAAPLLRDVEPSDLLGRKALTWNKDVDISPIERKVVLVTGAAGSIGSELCRQILSYNPAKLIMLDNNESGLHDIVSEISPDESPEILTHYLGDITNRSVLHRLFAAHRPQVVFHSAAYKHVPMLEYYPDEAVRVNINGTRIVAEMAREYGAERFVLISTDKAVKPSSVMGASKRVCELLMHAFSQQPDHNTLFTSVRFGNVLGSRGSVVPIFNRQIEAGGPVTVTDERMTRYFMTIPEAVNLVIHAACMTKGDDLFMLRMGEVVRIVELAERMIRLRGLVPYKDIQIESIGIRPGEKLHEELHSESEHEIPTIHPHIVELTHGKNGFTPDSLFDTLNRLTENGLDADKTAIDQLTEIIGSYEHLHGLTQDESIEVAG